MFKMKLRWIYFAAMLFLIFSTTIQAAIPRNEKEISLYPGAVRNAAAEKELNSQDSEYDEESKNTRRSKTVKVYTAKAIIDEVCKFYIDKLGAKPGVPVEDPDSLKPGTVYPPWYEMEYYGSNIFENQYEGKTLIHDGMWLKSAFTKRPQWKKGAWLCSTHFEWNIILKNGDMAQYTVSVEDEGYNTRKKVVFNTTRITIQVLVTKSEASLEEEEDGEMDEAVAEKTRHLMKNPPTATTLGIPIYPGSVFSPQNSAGMSLDGDYQYYIFLSNDSPLKVKAFYEQRLGRKASSDNGSYLIALKGKMPVPEEGLVIQSNTMFGGKAKTVITVQKKN